MNFRELFEKYKVGNATEEEKRIVESEREKYRILTDEYLEEDSDFCMDDGQTEPDKEELKKIKERGRSRTAKITLLAVLIVSVLALGFKYAVIPIINKHLFFGPEKNTISQGAFFSDLEIELETLTSLHMPQMRINSIFWNNTGIGKYDLTFALSEDGGSSSRTLELASMNKGKFVANPSFYFHGGLFNDQDFTERELRQIKNAEVEKLKKLPNAYIGARANLTLPKPISMESLSSYMKQYEELEFEWVAIAHEDSGGSGIYSVPMIGMAPDGSSIKTRGEDGDYPVFKEVAQDGSSLENYFKDLIRFQIKQNDLVKRFEEGDGRIPLKQFYQQALEYIEEDGVKSYGIIVKGHPSDILALYKEAHAKEINVDDIMFYTGNEY